MYHNIEKTIVGWELLSNDGKLKTVLRKITSQDENKGTINKFRAFFFVLDEGEWQQADNTHTFESEKDFLETMFKSEDFTDAYKELIKRKDELLPKKS